MPVLQDRSGGSEVITIPVDKCVCGNCKQWKPDHCELIHADNKTATTVACFHIWDEGNYILEDKE